MNVISVNYTIVWEQLISLPPQKCFKMLQVVYKM